MRCFVRGLPKNGWSMNVDKVKEHKPPNLYMAGFDSTAVPSGGVSSLLVSRCVVESVH